MTPTLPSRSRWPRPSFPKEGSIPTIVQDARDGSVLILGWSNTLSWKELRRSGELVLFSRSRQSIWRKGETSGNRARVVSAALDCDRDALLVRVLPSGPMCHTGMRSCFGDVLPGEESQTSPILHRLEEMVADRRAHPRKGSYTNELLVDEERRLKKVGEEATEVVVAAARNDGRGVVREATDLLYHLTVVLAEVEVTWAQVMTELSKRHSERRRR